MLYVSRPKPLAEVEVYLLHVIPVTVAPPSAQKSTSVVGRIEVAPGLFVHDSTPGSVEELCVLTRTVAAPETPKAIGA